MARRTVRRVFSMRGWCGNLLIDGMATNSLVIGLTGNIATGKSTVTAYLQGKGAYVIDADKVAHEVMEPGTDAFHAVVREFSPEILDGDGSIDRARLGAIVFNDTEKMGRLEQIVHPAVFQSVYNRIERLTPSIVVLEAVKLLEAGSMYTLCDEVWVVIADPAEQMRRAKEHRGMSEAETHRRMNMQSPQAAKINQADVVIYNDGSLDDLYEQLDGIWAALQQRYVARLRDAADQA